MNKSLAEQLHDLVQNYRVNITEELEFCSTQVNKNIDKMEARIKKLIEENNQIKQSEK